MSRDAHLKPAHEQRASGPLDRRIQRTLKLLHEALASLIREKAYDRITVEQILERASVGRSTFYTHFRDKDELLASSIRELLVSARSSEQSQSADPRERMIRFSLPFLEHIHRHRRIGTERMGKRGRAILHAHLRQVLADWIMQDIGGKTECERARSGNISQELLAQYLASTFVLVLHYWLDSRSNLSAVEANEMFRALVMPTLATPPK
jgi:AcrR family transcriptional regulator